MRDGFTFCDVDIADIGLHYAPNLENTYVYDPAPGDVKIETFEGHNGGHYYGTWSEPKEFTLRCYFESQKIDKGIMSKVHYLFKRGRSGKLIFRKRPWCYYYATVIDVNTSELLNYENGLITISMKATYPYARSDILYRSRTDDYHDNMLVNSAVYEHEGMVPDSSFEHLTSTTNFIIGNPGTERAHTGIYVDGDASSGILIRNLTTNQEMRLSSFTSAITTSVNKKLYIDSMTGKTTLKGASSSELAFRYHSSGFIELEPGYPAHRNIYISYADNNVITTQAFFAKDVIGQYIFANEKWHKIVDQPDRSTIVVADRTNGTGTERTQIMRMNELVVSPIDTMNINLSLVFKPTYA